MKSDCFLNLYAICNLTHAYKCASCILLLITDWWWRFCHVSILTFNNVFDELTKFQFKMFRKNSLKQSKYARWQAWCRKLSRSMTSLFKKRRSDWRLWSLRTRDCENCFRSVVFPGQISKNFKMSENDNVVRPHLQCPIEGSELWMERICFDSGLLIEKIIKNLCTGLLVNYV